MNKIVQILIKKLFGINKVRLYKIILTKSIPKKQFNILRYIYVLFITLKYVKFKQFNKNENIYIDKKGIERNQFINKYIDEPLEIDNIVYTQGILINSFYSFFIFILIYFSLWLIIPFLLLCFSQKINFNFLISFSMNTFNLFNSKRKNVYLFNVQKLEHILLLLYVTLRDKSINFFYCWSSSYVYNTCRYDCYRNTTIILCSKGQLKEFEYYKKIKWLKLENTSTQLWGNEMNIEYKKVSNFKYDLAFYSSGEWARIDGLKQTNDIEGIKESKYIDNSRWKKINEIITFLKSYATLNKLHLCVYLHPFEKKLFNNYQIIPPYYESSEYIHCPTSDENVSSLSEAEVAVTYASSAFYDRLNQDYETYFYFNENDRKELKYFYRKKILAEYGKFSYSNMEELENKLNIKFDIKVKNIKESI